VENLIAVPLFAALHESAAGPSQKLPRPTRGSAYRGYSGRSSIFGPEGRVPKKKQSRLAAALAAVEMTFVKRLFWSSEDCVVQFHPPTSDHINWHPYTLHM
jgi:hypothetical protein